MYKLSPSLSTPVGVDYVVIGFDMEVQPLVIHNAARPLFLYFMSTICVSVVNRYKAKAIRTYATSAIGIHVDVMGGHKLSLTGRKRCSHRYREQS